MYWSMKHLQSWCRGYRRMIPWVDPSITWRHPCTGWGLPEDNVFLVPRQLLWADWRQPPAQVVVPIHRWYFLLLWSCRISKPLQRDQTINPVHNEGGRKQIAFLDVKVKRGNKLSTSVYCIRAWNSDSQVHRHNVCTLSVLHRHF